MTARAEDHKVVVFSLGGQNYCLPVLSVREIRSYEKPTRLPFAAHYIMGAFNLRGVILTIVDLAAYLNLMSDAPDGDEPRNRVVIVVDVDGKICGLLVDRVIDMADIAASDIQPVSSHESIVGMITIKEVLTSVISLPVILESVSGP